MNHAPEVPGDVINYKDIQGMTGLYHHFHK